MVRPVSDLLRYDAVIDEQPNTITELFFSSRTWEGAYIGLDIGGWFESDQVIASAEILSVFDTKTRSVMVNTSRRAIEEAPRWEPIDGAPTKGATTLPALLVGRFGPISAPLILSSAPGNDHKSSGDATARRIERRYDLSTVWIGAEAHGSDGKLGRLDDLLFDPESMQITHFVVDNGKVLPGRQLVVPTETFCAFDEDAQRIELSISEPLLSKAPQIELLDSVDRHWVDTVRTYYQLPI